MIEETAFDTSIHVFGASLDDHIEDNQSIDAGKAEQVVKHVENEILNFMSTKFGVKRENPETSNRDLADYDAEAQDDEVTAKRKRPVSMYIRSKSK